MVASNQMLIVIVDALHMFRMELAFIVTFTLIWAVSSAVGSKSQTTKKPRKLPATHRWVGSGFETPSQAKHSIGRRRQGNNCQVPQGNSDGMLDLAHPSREELSDPCWVAAAVQQLCRTQVQRAVELYREALRTGLKLKEMPATEGAQLFMSLVTSSIRVGQIDDAINLLRDCRRGPGITAALCASCTKLCTSKQLFKECLVIYDFFSEDSTVDVEDRSVWSCLLFCAVEARAYQRCPVFFKRLQSCGPPSNKDYGNMVRCVSTHGDWQESLSLIREMRQVGLEVDSVVYNTALAACVAANKTDEARALLEAMESSDGVADVITYNTLSKGYAKAGRIDKCFELFEHMRCRNITPSQVTYGILLDCCINEKQMDKAVEVFNDMTSAGLVMNTVLYTTLIKGFARADQVEKAMNIYEQMCSEREKGVSPDLITFSILIKANCDAGHLKDALGLLHAMMDFSVCPDEVIFNNLLGGCVRENEAGLAKRLYNDMVKGGVKPSNATYSILIRLYAQSKMLDEAVEMLKTEPLARNVEPEPRLFMQLAQSCLRERQGRRAVEVYKLMIDLIKPSVAMHGSLLGMCSKLNMLDTAAEILVLAAENGGRVDMRDAVQLRDSAIRKRKVQCAELISATIARL